MPIFVFLATFFGWIFAVRHLLWRDKERKLTGPKMHMVTKRAELATIGLGLCILGFVVLLLFFARSG